MKDVMKAAHIFLQSFCLGNPDNQALMHKHLDHFIKVSSQSAANSSTSSPFLHPAATMLHSFHKQCFNESYFHDSVNL